MFRSLVNLLGFILINLYILTWHNIKNKHHRSQPKLEVLILGKELVSLTISNTTLKWSICLPLFFKYTKMSSIRKWQRDPVYFTTPIYKVHKSHRGISDTKEHYWENIVTIPSLKYCFKYMHTSRPKFVIPRSQVNNRKVAYPLVLIKQVVNLKERAFVLNGDLIDLTILIHILRNTSFLFTNNNGSLYGEILDWMKPLSNKCLSWAFNSLNSTREDKEK